ncbi:hypothetical protein [Timonella sp. A28]|uniref:hypothetical protein n=1 Tax=Timonella sp. A28 TaxID=3442640 RepID=UPI003EBF9D6C
MCSLSACTPENSAPPTTAISRVVGQDTMLVPRTIPEGWRYDSISASTTSSGDTSYQLMFVSKTLEDFPVQLCVAPSTSASTQCTNDDSSTPTTIDGVTAAWLFAGNDPSNPDIWTDLALTSAWQDTDWVNTQ